MTTTILATGSSWFRRSHSVLLNVELEDEIEIKMCCKALERHMAFSGFRFITVTAIEPDMKVGPLTRVTIGAKTIEG